MIREGQVQNTEMSGELSEIKRLVNSEASCQEI